MMAPGFALLPVTAEARTRGVGVLIALATLGLLLLGACGSDHTLIVTVIGVEPSIKRLRLQGTIDDRPLPVPSEVDASVISFHIPLSAALTGRVKLAVEGLGDDTCTTAEGHATTDLTPSGTVSLDVFLQPRSTAACPVVIEKFGDGDGTVRSADGTIACGEHCTAHVNRGTPLRLSVSLGERGHFIGWSGACSGTAECSLMVSGPITVKAHVVVAEVCSPGGFCWQNPQPQGHTIRALWTSAPSDLWAVGDQGLLMHWDGNSWAGLPSGITFGLYGIWGSRPDDLWAVGENGSVLHYDGTAWQNLFTNSTHWLHAVWGVNSHDVWAVGDEGAVLHYDGVRWTPATLPTNASLYTVWGTASNDVWAVGYGGIAWHFDGAQWQQVRIGTNLLVNALWGTGPKDVWAVGQDFTANAGAIWHYEDRLGSFRLC